MADSRPALFAILLLVGTGVTAGGHVQPQSPTFPDFETERIFCPPQQSQPHETAGTCLLPDFNETQGSTSLLVIGANTSSPENVTVEGSAGSAYTALVHLTSGGEQFWVFIAMNVSPLWASKLWVNLSDPTRYIVGAIDVASTAPSSLDAASLGLVGVGTNLTQNLTTHYPDDAVLVAAFDNDSRAPTVCGFNGTLLLDGADINGNGTTLGTYRNLEAGEYIDPSVGSASISLSFGKQASGRCEPASTPFLGVALAFKAGSSPAASPPPPLTASFTFGPTPASVGQPVTFNADVSGGTPPYYYAWSFGDGSNAYTENATHTYSSSDDYSVRLRVSDSNYTTAVATEALSVGIDGTTYSVTLEETGLPGGSEWSVDLAGGTPYSSTNDTVSLTEPNGTFTYEISSANPIYEAPSGSFTVAGAGTAQEVTFRLVTYPVTFEATGLRAGAEWYLNVTGGPAWNLTTGSVTMPLPNGTYQYVVGVSLLGRKGYSAKSGTLEVLGAASTRTVGFVRVEPVTFKRIGLPGTTEWWVNVSGDGATSAGASSTGRTLRFWEPKGNYTYTVANPNGDYSAKGGSFSVTASVSKTVRFRLLTYVVTFAESGLPPGSRWCVEVTNEGAHCSRKVALAFRAPNGTYSYALTTTWPGYSGSGGYFVVNGTAVETSVTFQGAGGLPASLAVGIRGGDLGLVSPAAAGVRPEGLPNG